MDRFSRQLVVLPLLSPAATASAADFQSSVLACQQNQTTMEMLRQQSLAMQQNSSPSKPSKPFVLLLKPSKASKGAFEALKGGFATFVWFHFLLISFSSLIAFVFGSKTWLKKWQLSHGFAWVLAHSCPKMQLSHGFAVRQSIFP